MSISIEHCGCLRNRRPEGWTDEDEKTLQAEFTYHGSCGCDGAMDFGCPWCTPKKFDEWWANRQLQKARLMNALLGTEVYKPITVGELLANPERVSKLYIGGDNCADCGTHLSGFVTGKNPSPDGTVCDDCHYGQIGDEIDEHPIGGVK